MSEESFSRNLPGTVYSPFCANESDYIKQKFLFTAICVAGKTAVVQQKKVDTFCENVCRWNGGKPEPVFNLLSSIPIQKLTEALSRELRVVRMGQYTRLIKTIEYLCALCRQDASCLNTIGREELIQCPGVGMKTASFYLLNTRPGVLCAVLDTHILRWLREKRGYTAAPSASPIDVADYKLWEAVYFGEMFKDGYAVKDIAEFDLALWKQGAGVE